MSRVQVDSLKKRHQIAQVKYFFPGMQLFFPTELKCYPTSTHKYLSCKRIYYLGGKRSFEDFRAELSPNFFGNDVLNYAVMYGFAVPAETESFIKTALR